MLNPFSRSMDDPHAAALAERVKELTALYETATWLQRDDCETQEWLERIAALLPAAFHFPDIAEARVQHGTMVAKTSRMDDAGVRLDTTFVTKDARLGSIVVVYRTADAIVGTEGAPVDGTDIADWFLPEEQRLLDTLGRMLQAALDRRVAEEDARRAAAQLKDAAETAERERQRAAMLLDVANAVSSERDLDALLGTISRLLARTVEHHFASATLWEEESKTLRRHALTFGPGRGVIQSGVLLRTDRLTPARVAFDRQETMVFRQPEIAALGEHSQSVMNAEGLAAACCIPIRTRRGVVGTINFGSAQEESFQPDEVRMLEQIVGQIAIAVDNALAYGEISALKDRLTEEKNYLADEVSGHNEFEEIIGQSSALTSVITQIKTVAPTDATVLLLGETGTGKELLARALHTGSRRSQQPFVRVNCAALPLSLVESELFGHERGAFTGAVSAKIGRFELAHRGTLFLDEAGELPMEVQPKLLRALQEQEFERVGGTKTIRVDGRLIAATNRDLERMVDEGTFRRDLYYRLSVFPIDVPPLRERPEDIGPLVRHFARRFARELGRPLPAIAPATLTAFEEWAWPGNIRELQNVVERATILSRGGELRVPPGAFPRGGRERHAARIHEAASASANVAHAAPLAASSTAASLEDHQREMILAALRAANGIVAGPDGAAARLGLKRTTLQSKMRKLGITRPSF
ncbi:MAG: sigma 54-interacting transcriptional regulator [Vicinamibacterales bacterium]